MLKSTFSGYNSVADDTGLSIFIRLAVVASQICEIPLNSLKIRTQFKVIQGHRSWCQSNVHYATYYYAISH